MLSKLVSQVVVFGTPLIMVCLFIAFIGLFIYFNRRIDRIVDRVNTLSELVSVLQDIVNTRPNPTQQQQPVPVPVQSAEDSKIVHVPEKIVVSDGEEEEEEEEEEDYVSTSEEEEEVPTITITKIEHSPEPITVDENEQSAADVDAEEQPIEIDADEQPIEIDAVENQPVEIDAEEQPIEIDEQNQIGLIDDDLISVVSMSAPTVIPEPQLEEICTNAVLKERFLSTNYRGYKVNQLRDLATDLHLIKDKDASKLKKSELLTFLDKTYVNLKNWIR